MLDVVSTHQIVFDYQEDAIIKKFNAALQNLGNLISYFSLDYEGSTDLESEQIIKQESNEGITKIPENQEEEDKIDPISQKSIQEVSNMQSEGSDEEKSNDTGSLKIISSPPSVDFNKKSVSNIDSLSKSIMFDKRLTNATNTQKLNVIQNENSQFARRVTFKENAGSIGKVLGSNLSNDGTMNLEEIMESQIKDSLYKAFMVAFTHESSHHLLFNEDLIEIALFWLEYWREISIDVKK